MKKIISLLLAVVCLLLCTACTNFRLQTKKLASTEEIEDFWDIKAYFLDGIVDEPLISYSFDYKLKEEERSSTSVVKTELTAKVYQEVATIGTRYTFSGKLTITEQTANIGGKSELKTVIEEKTVLILKKKVQEYESTEKVYEPEMFISIKSSTKGKDSEIKEEIKTKDFTRSKLLPYLSNCLIPNNLLSALTAVYDFCFIDGDDITLINSKKTSQETLVALFQNERLTDAKLVKISTSERDRTEIQLVLKYDADGEIRIPDDSLSYTD